ncbi:MAG: tail fiber domain-containing protein [Ferruginibacter sp.]
MKKYFFLFFLLAVLVNQKSNAQNVAINNSGNNADASAMLDVQSTTKGLLIPKMNQVQRNQILSPAVGLLIYQTDVVPGYYYYNGASWIQFSTGSASNFWSLNGTSIYSNVAGNVGIGAPAPINRLQIGTFSSPSISGNDIAIGNGTQAMSFYQSPTTSGWYTTNNFALLPGVGGTGNVGIGTSTPLAKLSVQTGGNNYGLIHTDGITTVGTYIGNNKGWLGTRSNHPLSFFTYNSTEQMTLLQNGNLGIGTTSPSSILNVHTPNNTDGFMHSSDGGIILKDVVGGISASMGTFSNHIFRLVANSNPVINIEPSGNVGIGVSGATNKLQIGSLGTYTFNGDDLTLGNGTEVTGFSQTNTGLRVNSTKNISLVTFQGGVGINTYTPRAPLDVVGNVSANNPNSGGYFAYFTLSGMFANYGTVTNTSTIPNVSIIASNRILASEFDAYSDARIKNIISQSSSTKDLEIINKISITDYTMKDKVKYGNSLFKKVIAQEIEKVYPQVVTKHTDFVPNTYQLTSKVKRVANGYLLHFTGKHNISSSAKKLQVLLPGKDAMQQVGIISIPSDNEVLVDLPEIVTDKIFVYGEEVSDFRTVDYEGLTTLNISATQELSKIIDAQNKKIEMLVNEIELLKKSNTNYRVTALH